MIASCLLLIPATCDGWFAVVHPAGKSSWNLRVGWRNAVCWK
jgi:hypothetical protein